MNAPELPTAPEQPAVTGPVQRRVSRRPDRVVCQFSCGAASAVATKLALAQYGDRCVIVNAYVKQEHEDNRRKAPCRGTPVERRVRRVVEKREERRCTKNCLMN